MKIDVLGFVKEHKDIILPVVGLVLVILLMGYMSSDLSTFSLNTGGSTPLSTSTTASTPDQSKNGKYSSIPTMNLKSGVDYQAEIRTNYGTIVVDLFEKDTPVTVNSFVFLANEGYYDNLISHRVIQNFMIQAGDPLGTGTGGPGYSYNDEIDADAIGLGDTKVADYTVLQNSNLYSRSVLDTYAGRSVKEMYEEVDNYRYTPGYGSNKFGPFVLAMANSGPGTNGSQFFITTRNTGSDHLNGKHTVFGKVVSGQDIVDSIEKVSVDGLSKPITSVVFEKVTILEK